MGNISALCLVYRISRVTAYKWIERFEAEGRAGLQDRSSRPHQSPQATDPQVVEQVIAMRKHHGWGPKKLAPLLAAAGVSPPALSTIGDILRRAGLVRTSRRRRPRPLAQPSCGRGEKPNDVWCTDYKGEFLLGNGRYCYPLTVTDEASRYLLECRAFERINGEDVKARFLRLFRSQGLPKAIRSDNGSPFAGVGIARLSRVSVWWLKLGITLERNLPGHPQDNGRHERMHRDLKAEATRPPGHTNDDQQKLLTRFQGIFNNERPHEALGQQIPAKHYRPSQREY